MNDRSLWITWEEQRRTTEMAERLRIPLVRFLDKGPYWLRIFKVTVKTVSLLAKRRPRIVFVQNPSIVLAALVCLLKDIGRFEVVVDRHSNFKFDTLGSKSLKYRGFHALSRYSLRTADLTIVTNRYLADVVEAHGGRALVLPDAIPGAPRIQSVDLGPGHHILYVCSFDADEPVALVLEAAALLPDDVQIHVTGDSSRADPAVLAVAPENVRWLGFVSEQDYWGTMSAVDVVLTLTTQDHTLQCGAYEGVSVGVPLVFADHAAMRTHFHKGAVPTVLTPQDLASALVDAIADNARLRTEVSDLKQELMRQWELDVAPLEERLARAQESA